MEAGGEHQFSDRAKVNGISTTVSLTADGKLRWSNRCLAVEKEVLGFAVEGSKLRIKALIERGVGICCSGSKGTLLKKTFTFEPLSENQLRLWSQKLQQLIDSLGKRENFFFFFSFLLSLIVYCRIGIKTIYD